MSDASKIWPAEFCRRSILRNLVLTAAGVAMLRTTMGNRVAAAETKVTQKAAEYQGTPKGAQQCGNCTHFDPPASCKVVDGNIVPTGWCKMYVKKSA